MGSCSFYIHNITQPGRFCNMQIYSLALLNNTKGLKALFLMGRRVAMDTPISRAEHEEFCRRMEIENKRLADEDTRLGRRIALLEDNTKQIQTLVTNVERLAVSMENMAKTQAEQSSRLDDLEARDGEKWRQVTGYIITAIIGVLIGLVTTHLGL